MSLTMCVSFASKTQWPSLLLHILFGYKQMTSHGNGSIESWETREYVCVILCQKQIQVILSDSEEVVKGGGILW